MNAISAQPMAINHVQISKVVPREIDPAKISTIQKIGLTSAINLPPKSSFATSGK